MNDQTDSQLLRAYVEQRSEPAFAELVRRHLDFVYSAAQRMVCDSHLAQDVTQGVFVALAKQAPRLMDHPVLSGWLHGTAQNIAAQTVRTEVRRRAREQEAATMNELPESEAGWKQLAPHLDDALGELSEADRDALLLRYFKHKSAQEMAQILGVSDEAAQKRVSRAVERLRELFAQRGVTVGAGGLAVVISANAVAAAPTGLAVTIAAAALAETAVTTSTIITAAKTIAMTTLQKTVLTTAFVAAAGAGIFEAHQAVQLREQIQTLQQQQAPLAEQIQRLQTERDDATNRLALMAERITKVSSDNFELLKLRGEVGVLRKQLDQAMAKPKQIAPQIKFQIPYSSREEWSEEGTDSPLHTLHTMLWAIKQKDENRLNQIVLRTDALHTLDRMTLPKSSWDTALAIQIVSSFTFRVGMENGGQDMAQIEAILEEKETDSDISEVFTNQTVQSWSLVKTNNQWLISGSH